VERKEVKPRENAWGEGFGQREINQGREIKGVESRGEDGEERANPNFGIRFLFPSLPCTSLV